jgi:hypothetical protein
VGLGLAAKETTTRVFFLTKGSKHERESIVTMNQTKEGKKEQKINS